MMLPIYLYGHPVLRNVSIDIDKDYPDLKKLVDNMWTTMYESDGIGLAAPQIGLNIRLVVIDADVLKDVFPEVADRKLTLINPKLEVLDDVPTVTREEGCLSLPGIHENVPRHEKIHLTWLDENFEPHDEIFEGYIARVIQHEYDHLEGKMFIDHISPIRKQLIRNKLHSILTGKTRCDYRTKSAPKK